MVPVWGKTSYQMNGAVTRNTWVSCNFWKLCRCQGKTPNNSVRSVNFLSLVFSPTDTFWRLLKFKVPDGQIPVGWKKLFPQPTKRKKYLCADEVAARKNFVYNFECLEEGPPCLSAVWYTICGSPICNRFQFFLNIFSLALLVCSIFSKILFSDVKKMEIVKRLIVKLHLPVDFTREERAGRHTSEPVAPQEEEEVTVGYVLVQLDPLSTKCIPKKIQWLVSSLCAHLRFCTYILLCFIL